MTHLELVARPPLPEDEELARPQGFVTIGALSSIYSTICNVATLSEDGDLEHLGHATEPGMIGTLVPADYWSREDRQLPLWMLQVHPSTGPAAGE